MKKHEVKLSLKAESFDTAGTFEGYASVFGNEDAYGDVVEAGAFARTIKNRIKRNGKADFPVLWNHDPSEPIGMTVAMEEDAKGLHVKGQLNLEVQRAREIYALMRQGAISGMSIGFTTIRDKVVEGKRKLLELRLWEWSPVTFPANEAAGVESVRSVAFGEVPAEEVQSLIFDKEEWDREEACKWAADHSFKSDKVEESTSSWKLQQREASSEIISKAVSFEGFSGLQAIVGKATPAIETPDPAQAFDPQLLHSLATNVKALIQSLS